MERGDLYVALPGAARHGADFVSQAVDRGAVAVLTDDAGARLLALSADTAGPGAGGGRAAQRGGAAVRHDLPAASLQPASTPRLFGVTGTNGKTTTTYFINALLRALGQRTGLIGTIEILAGGDPIPSLLTTPESTDVHALLALMRERGLDAASMEVSSHAVSFQRVDGVVFDVAGFTNLTQDHLDLHGTMDDYFATKAELFTPRRARTAVVTVDDEWGRRLAATAEIPVTTLATTPGGASADWTVTATAARGLGTDVHPERARRRHPARPHRPARRLQRGQRGAGHGDGPGQRRGRARPCRRPWTAHDPFTVAVPGRMQLVSEEPAAVVDFAHNTDALARALEAVRSPLPGSRVIVVFGATGQRDQGKRPAMGAIAAKLADVVIVTDDDPHDEDAAAIRADVLAGARAAQEQDALECVIEEIYPARRRHPAGR